MQFVRSVPKMLFLVVCPDGFPVQDIFVSEDRAQDEVILCDQGHDCKGSHYIVRYEKESLLVNVDGSFASVKLTPPMPEDFGVVADETERYYYETRP